MILKGELMLNVDKLPVNVDKLPVNVDKLPVNVVLFRDCPICMMWSCLKYDLFQ